uniref:sarcosine dehydrogenase, mitochondrial-like isoform X1 n=2 Tax=Styela clava TaxID=7725 RepID=UPI00193A99DE|nr:sarcosine dehydrogenase, mitochondrial-like isoform X1 [Styela clava]
MILTSKINIRHILGRISRNLSPLKRNFIKNYNQNSHDVPYKNSLKRSSENNASTTSVLPESADVVIIGGGSVGCSTAYHLAKLDIGKVVLIEKDKLTSGTTWHSAGILWNLRGHRSLTQMQIHTQQLLSRILPEETGFDSGWIKTGSIYLTRRETQMDALEKLSLMGSELGVELRMIDTDEISKLHPLIDTGGILGGLYSPDDGSLDPATLCTSYIKAATKYKAQVIEKCEVKYIKTDGDIPGKKTIVSIETNLGSIRTNKVINCTGAWAPYIAKMVGMQLPQLTYKIAYVVTQGIPGIENVPHLRDLDKGVYHKRQGDALLFGGYEKNLKLVGLVEKDFSFGLYDMDWNRFEPHIKSATDLVPAVAKVGIRSTVCGPESFTPDGNPLIGESQYVKGFFNASAFNSGGMMLGGGAGKQIARWVAYGKPEIDLGVCDLNRFSSTYNEAWLKESCHEHVSTRYEPKHHNQKPLAGRNLRTTPLSKIHLRKGAYFTCIHGWEVPEFFMPGQTLPLLNYDYSGCYGYKKNVDYKYREIMDRDGSHLPDVDIHKKVGIEVEAISNSAAIVDLSHLSQFEISGSESDKIAKQLFTCDVTNLLNNHQTETLMLNEEGKILSYVTVNKHENKYRITAPSQQQEFILHHINQLVQYNIYNCSVEDITGRFALLTLWGPERW